LHRRRFSYNKFIKAPSSNSKEIWGKREKIWAEG
jgi:hypothetical protein